MKGKDFTYYILYSSKTVTSHLVRIQYVHTWLKGKGFEMEVRIASVLASLYRPAAYSQVASNNFN